MDNNNEYKFECYEEYFGTVEEVAKKIDECKFCQSKLVMNHLPDYKNLIIQETARCLDCGQSHRKIIYGLN